jgi:hypothetical protein
MTAIEFSLSVHPIVTAQTRLECFGTFVVYMLTVSSVKVTFGCVSLLAVKSAFTLVSIFMMEVGINYIKNKLPIETHAVLL